MKLNRYVSLLCLISGAFLLASPCGAQTQIYETTQANAILRAKAEGKMILTEFGRPNCGDCIGMKGYFETDLRLKQSILASCVLWTADIDHSNEWPPYIAPLTGFALPVMCFVDPAKPGKYTLRKTGLVDSYTFTGYVQSQAKKNLPLVVTNLPANPLDNGSFVVKGVARTNAAFNGSISNAAIDHIMWRLNGSGDFQQATGTTNWSQSVMLPHGTNIFESYVQYAGPKNSWTNRVTLINLGPNPPNVLTAQTITFNPLTDQTYGVAPIILTATASSGLPVTLTVTSGPAAVSNNVLTIAGAGTFVVRANQAGNATYSAAPSVPQTFTVNTATLTITAENKQKVVGTANPTLTASYNGFVNNESTNNLTAQATLSTTVDINTPVGTYTITASGASAANYAITHVNGNLTVLTPIKVTSILRQGNGTVDITGTADASKTYAIQGSTDLVTWQDIGTTTTNGSGALTFNDANATSHNHRFYRLKL